MDTSHAETVVEKTVNFVKDVFGIPHDAAPDPKPDPELRDAESQVVAEQAMSLDPNAFVVSPSGQVVPGNMASPIGDASERLREDIDDPSRLKSLSQQNDEIVRRENGV